jgi:putative tricarboxylic transport membrane protein
MTGSASSFLSYIAERKVSKYPERFGTGLIEGVAGPETANNAHANGAIIPLFTLGIPASPTVAVIMGAFMMHGLIPGPFLFKEHPEVAWGVIASFYVGNIILLILNLPLVGIWVKILKIPYGLLFGVILAFMVVGASIVTAPSTWGHDPLRVSDTSCGSWIFLWPVVLTHPGAIDGAVASHSWRCPRDLGIF